MHCTTRMSASSPAAGPFTLFLCVNGSEEQLQRALESAGRRGNLGVMLSLSRRIAEKRRPSITHVTIRWKRAQQVLGHLEGTVVEIADADRVDGERLLADRDPDARPWPSLRPAGCGCVLRVTGLSSVASEANWIRIASPQNWSYLPGYGA